MKCPGCGFENPEDHRFCGKFAHDLKGDQPTTILHPALNAERRYVTALFLGLSGYTSMASKLDPEEVKEITSRVFDGMRGIVSKYKDFIKHFVGDGVMGLLGVPKSHEDDPIRAVPAARDIHALVESSSSQYQSKVGRSLSTHSGVNTGLAVTADRNPDKAARHKTVDQRMSLT
jgi:class 3 adenylate cyclase